MVATDYCDSKGNHLKTLTVFDIVQVEGIWTRLQLAEDGLFGQFKQTDRILLGPPRLALFLTQQGQLR